MNVHLTIKHFKNLYYESGFVIFSPRKGLKHTHIRVIWLFDTFFF